MRSKSWKALVALLAMVTLVGAACGNDKKDDTAAATTTTAAASTNDSAAGNPEGPACSAVPADGAGSFAGMASDPVGTAASNNPALSTLVTAVVKADLVDTLNTGGPFTVFAPINDAFAAIPEADLNKVLADKATLTKILTYHVIPERIESADLGGDYTTVEGDKLTVSGSGPGFKVNGANVVCAGIQTDNATVYLIDSVLMPPSAG
jgi:uncharacterized surface protein with fasciclin (FAS1) repeats